MTSTFKEVLRHAKENKTDMRQAAPGGGSKIEWPAPCWPAACIRSKGARHFFRGMVH